MDKFPLICTMAVIFVFFAGACGVAGVQNMKLRDDVFSSIEKKFHVNSNSSFKSERMRTVTTSESAHQELEQLLSPRKQDKADAFIDSSMITGIKPESLSSIKDVMSAGERKISMDKSIEVRGEILVNF
ncbi:hypothetical protein ACFLQ8_01060 [Candidatus Auribacterota bacterium]